jgi:hypothetical protein
MLFLSILLSIALKRSSIADKPVCQLSSNELPILIVDPDEDPEPEAMFCAREGSAYGMVWRVARGASGTPELWLVLVYGFVRAASGMGFSLKGASSRRPVSSNS